MDAQRQALRLNDSMACPISPRFELAAVPACDRLGQGVEGKAKFGGFALQVLDFTRPELFLIAFGVHLTPAAVKSGVARGSPAAAAGEPGCWASQAHNHPVISYHRNRI